MMLFKTFEVGVRLVAGAFFLEKHTYSEKNVDKKTLTNESMEKVAYSRTRPVGPVEVVHPGGSHGSPTLSGDILCCSIFHLVLLLHKNFSQSYQLYIYLGKLIHL